MRLNNSQLDFCRAYYHSVAIVLLSTSYLVRERTTFEVIMITSFGSVQSANTTKENWQIPLMKD